MRLVNRPVTRPMHCAAYPHIGQTRDNTRWIDTGSELPGFDNHVYLSSHAVKDAARLLGYPTPEEHADAKTQLANLQAELERVTQERDDLDAVVSSIDAIESADFRARRKSGRRPVKPEEVAA